MNRRRMLAVAGIGVLGIVVVALAPGPPESEARAAGMPRLYVFVNSTEKPRAMQERLQAKMPRVAVTVFGRHRDFEDALTESPPDAVVALRPALEELGLTVSLQGVTDAHTEETYVLLSVDKAVRPEHAETVGSVDLLGRSRMKAFVTNVLKVSAAPKLKLVSKTEDLLPLLQFGVTDAVLLPQRHTQAVMLRSELRLVSTPLPTKVGLTAVAALSANGIAVVRIIESLDTETSVSMGAESWQ